MKYLNLQQNKYIQIGGDNIQVTSKNSIIKTQIFRRKNDIKITDNEILNLLNTAFKINLKEHIPLSEIDGEAIMWKIYYDNKLVGYGVTLDLKQFESDPNFEYNGGIKNKKGLYITSVAGNPGYSGIVKLLFNNIKKYAKENDYDYLLLEATKYEPNYLEKLYKNQGFISITERKIDEEKIILMCNNIKEIKCDEIIKKNLGLVIDKKYNKVIHITGFLGFDKNIGNKLKKIFGDNIVVYDTDKFYKKKKEKKENEIFKLETELYKDYINDPLFFKFAEYLLGKKMDEFINKHKDKIIVFIGSLDNFSPINITYKMKAKHRILLNIPSHKIIKRYNLQNPTKKLTTDNIIKNYKIYNDWYINNDYIFLNDKEIIKYINNIL